MIAVVVLVFHLLGFVSSIHAVMRNRTAQGAIAWGLSLNSLIREHEREIGMPRSETLGAEVPNISRHGFWLYIDASETFVSFEEFPWLRDASVEAILTVARPSERHLYWPKLDVDLTLEMIEHPERFPLKARIETPNPA